MGDVGECLNPFDKSHPVCEKIHNEEIDVLLGVIGIVVPIRMVEFDQPARKQFVVIRVPELSIHDGDKSGSVRHINLVASDLLKVGAVGAIAVAVNIDAVSRLQAMPIASRDVLCFVAGPIGYGRDGPREFGSVVDDCTVI